MPTPSRWTSRLVSRFILTLLVTVTIAHSLAVAQQKPATTAQPPSAGVAGKYNGPGGCAASNCHGSVQPKTVTRIAQNEYSIWVVQDKHARAYNVLSNPVSTRIGKILNLDAPPNKSEKCLTCHALSVPPELRATTFSLEDGVSCENCHGPAVGWLGPHTTKDWKHEQSLKLGMYDTRDLVKRSEKCLSCHLGTADKQVDHEMIAAGHPDLTFELDSFSAVMPRHWKPREKEPWLNVQEWSVGQAVQLREGLNRLSRRASGPKWPEFGEMECFACHHSLTKAENSWRQARGYPARTPGAVPWNAARYIVFRHVAAEVDPASGKELDAALNRVADLVAKRSNPQEIATASRDAANLADNIARRLQAQQFNQALTARLLQSIAADAQAIAADGERTAEQAAMALDALSLAYQKNVKTGNQQELRAAINRLFQQLENPSQYNGEKFAAQLEKVKVLLPPASAESAVVH